jgi:hypothetical protein
VSTLSTSAEGENFSKVARMQPGQTLQSLNIVFTLSSRQTAHQAKTYTVFDDDDEN